MQDIYKEAGYRIYLLRTKQGYSRENLAELAGISSKFLYEIESGKKGFSGIALYQICKALNADCHYILTGETAGQYDRELAAILELFDHEKRGQLANILKEIYAIL